MKTTVIGVLVLAALPGASFGMEGHVTMQPDAVQWGAAPAMLPPGSEVAVIAGDPSKDGPYVVRVRMPDGYKVAPHTHPTDENVTVLSGTLNFGMGGNFDSTKGEAIPAGGFFVAPHGMQHYSWSTSPTVIQIHGMGPFQLDYVNPADDPRTKATTGSK